MFGLWGHPFLCAVHEAGYRFHVMFYVVLLIAFAVHLFNISRLYCALLRFVLMPTLCPMSFPDNQSYCGANECHEYLSIIWDAPYAACYCFRVIRAAVIDHINRIFFFFSPVLLPVDLSQKLNSAIVLQYGILRRYQRATPIIDKANGSLGPPTCRGVH